MTIDGVRARTGSAGARRAPGAARAFTLVEMLVVMAISSILLGLLFGPLIQGFDLLRAAQVQVMAYDTARIVMERVDHDLAEGAFVFDHGGSAVNIWVAGSGGTAVAVPVPFAMVDVVPPAHEADLAAFSAANTDPTTGLPVERGPVILPVAPGRVIVRYWLGLADNTTTGGTSGQPVKPYKNFFEDRAHLRPADSNRVLLYRAVVSPYLPTGEVDTRLFHVDANGQPVIYDPNFFYDDTEAQAPNASMSAKYEGATVSHSDGKIRLSDNWRAAARSLVPPGMADMVRIERAADGTLDYTQIEPLIRFQPAQIVGDLAVPVSAGDAGNESPGAPATTFHCAHGHWNIPFSVQVYRGGLDASPLEYYFWNGAGTLRHRTAQFSGGAWSLLSDTDTGFDPATMAGSAPALMFSVDAVRGVVNFGIDDSVLLKVGTGTFEPSQFLASAANAEMATSGYRCVSLKSLTYPASRTSPLSSVPNARVVAGSETVRGPDMRPGPNYGNTITYTRVPRRGDPMRLGLNEYMINYADAENLPTEAAQYPERYTHLFAGTLIFNSRQDGPGVRNSLPETDGDANPAVITVRYRLQNNLSGDVVKVDYLTRQLMSFSLGVRLYDGATGQAQQVNLAQRVQVQNLQR